MSPITSVTYHIHTPTLDEVQAVVPFYINPLDRRTASWYLLGIVFGRDDEKIWDRSGPGPRLTWPGGFDVDDPIIAIALSLCGDLIEPAELGLDLMQMFMKLDVERTTAVLTAMLLYQHIADGTWEPTAEARQAEEEARIAALPSGAPEFDDTSKRAED